MSGKEGLLRGDYVLATKYQDGKPADQWAVGFYDRRERDRHFVLDGAGMQCSPNGFRRVGKITTAEGYWLLSNKVGLEVLGRDSNLWAMLRSLAPSSSESET